MLNSVQELKLIARCIAFDDRDAFGLLVDNYTEPLKRFLYNLTGCNAALTDDLAQETFLKAWINLRQFKGVAKFKTWLFRIAYNEFIDDNRRNHILKDDISVAENFGESPMENVTDAIDAYMLVSTLNDKEKAVTLLFYMQELPIKKISEITGMPQGTVKVYLSRAREKMKFIVEREYPV